MFAVVRLASESDGRSGVVTRLRRAHTAASAVRAAAWIANIHLIFWGYDNRVAATVHLTAGVQPVPRFWASGRAASRGSLALGLSPIRPRTPRLRADFRWSPPAATPSAVLRRPPSSRRSATRGKRSSTGADKVAPSSRAVKSAFALDQRQSPARSTGRAPG